MSSLPLYELQAELCRSMGHPVRLELIHLLRDGPKRAGDLVQTTGYKQGTVSRHLAVMRNSGILIAQHHGKDILYQLVDTRILELCDLMRQVLVEQAARRSKVLETFDKAISIDKP